MTASDYLDRELRIIRIGKRLRNADLDFVAAVIVEDSDASEAIRRERLRRSIFEKENEQ